MTELALIGYPLEHSYSAEYFNKRFIREGIDARYFNYPITSIDQLPHLLATHPLLVGFNVTSPYKVEILRYVDEAQEEVRHTGAANLIIIDRTCKGRARLIAYNTDVIGFTQSIQPFLSPHHKRALLLGTGGAAQAVLYALYRLGIEVTLVSRTSQRGLQTKEDTIKNKRIERKEDTGMPNHFSTLTYGEVTPDIIAQHPIVINATPVGMNPLEHMAPPLPYDALTPQHLCYDLIYNPRETIFLKQANRQGAQTVNGMAMLLAQAEANLILWQQYHPQLLPKIVE